MYLSLIHGLQEAIDTAETLYNDHGQEYSAVPKFCCRHKFENNKEECYKKVNFHTDYVTNTFEQMDVNCFAAFTVFHS